MYIMAFLACPVPLEGAGVMPPAAGVLPPSVAIATCRLVSFRVVDVNTGRSHDIQIRPRNVTRERPRARLAHRWGELERGLD